MKPEALAKRRYKEAMNAKEILKLSDYEILDHHDGNLQNSIEIQKEVAKIYHAYQKMLRKINEEENEGAGNNIVYGEAEINGSQVEVNGESFDWDNLLIATGARPFIPDIPGSQYGLTNRDILKIDKVPEKLNIVGGGIIAVEVANIVLTGFSYLLRSLFGLLHLQLRSFLLF